MERPEAVFRKWLDDITHLPFSQLLELYATAENSTDCDNVGFDTDNGGDCEEGGNNGNDPKAAETLIIRDLDSSKDWSADDRDHKEINLSGNLSSIALFKFKMYKNRLFIHFCAFKKGK
jgi:hypothetical protein